jgi:parallel beta-helix repeat protein
MTRLDVIAFTIPSGQCVTLGGFCTIAPTSALPTITEAAILDGRSQGGPSYQGRPLIELSGTDAGSPVDGLTITGGGNNGGGGTIVRGLTINRFSGSGVVLSNSEFGAVIDNQIGTDASGIVAAGNLITGILVDRSVESIISNNVISANGVGIAITNQSDLVTIRGNLIGTDRLGAAALGNRGDGIYISQSSSVYVGGVRFIDLSLNAAPNTIAHNHGAGVRVLAGTINTVTSNRIFGNVGLGIDLDAIGVLPNDALDADDGADHLQNSPTVMAAHATAGGTRISATLASAPRSSHHLSFYASPTCDPSGFGEGRDYLGSSPILGPNADGTLRYEFVAASVPVGSVITATASAIENPAATFVGYSTSEFSACRTVGTPGIVVTPTGPLVTTEAGGAATFTVALQDAPSADVTIPLSSSNPAEGRVSAASLTFTPATWSTPRTVIVKGVDDAIADGDVGYTIAIGPATSADVSYDGLDPDDLAMTNQDDEGTPVLSIAEVSVVEGSAGTTTATFEVSLVPASSQPVTVRYATADGLATAPDDYAAASGSLTFAPGERSKRVEVPVVGDTLVELDEAFEVVLAGPRNATIGRERARGTIRDDDGAVPPGSACSPRPVPRIASRQIGPGRLEVTVTAQETPGLPSNALQRLDFGVADNARVEVPGAAPGTPGGPSSTRGDPAGTPGNFSLTVPAGSASTTFVVQRQRPGPFNVRYVVVDGCHGSGPFTTFVGGGIGVP